MGNCILCLNKEYLFRNVIHDIELENSTISNTNKFIPDLIHAKVIKVYDGDTITVAARLLNGNNKIYKWTVRLDGIDTPEMNSKDENEKRLAQIAKDALQNRLLLSENNKTVQLKQIKYDKYGRILAKVYFGNECINDWMLNEKYAVEYHGGTKIKI